METKWCRMLVGLLSMACVSVPDVGRTVTDNDGVAGDAAAGSAGVGGSSGIDAAAGQGGSVVTTCTAPPFEVSVFDCGHPLCEPKDILVVLDQNPARHMYEDLSAYLDDWLDESCLSSCTR